ncbi:Uncharacterised protein [Dorea longicatena]|uniref:Uncharacterized protein n=2 Tax=Dorea longicatena TaxID=88431 RepID=A0A173RH47_9FIRM|nr:Uncharacterised protein [Dorea longicatena]
MALGGFCVAMLRQGHHGRVATRVPRRFRAAAFRPVSKPKARSGIEDEAFSNRGRSSGSQTKDAEEMKMSKFSNRGRSSGSQTLWGLHVGKKNVQQPWQIKWFSNNTPDGKSPWTGSATMVDQAVLKHSGGNSYYTIGSATMADRAVLKPRWLRVIPIGSSATMADQAVLKLAVQG